MISQHSQVALAKIEAFLIENEEFDAVIKVDTDVVLALVRYARAHGAETVGDLTPEATTNTENR